LTLSRRSVYTLLAPGGASPFLEPKLANEASYLHLDVNSGERAMTESDSEKQPNQVDDATQNTSALAGDLEGQLAAARAEAEQYKDKYLREYADKDNYRKRAERMAEDRIRREKRDFLEKMFDVVDNLDRAMRFQDTLDRDTLLQTLRMTQWQMGEALKSEGLTPVATVGEVFNPYVHEAVETVRTGEYTEGTVVEEVRKGYRMGDETVRPARVKVSAGPDA
jgi:molecular chaperone GrpE